MGASDRALALHLKYPFEFVAFSRGFTSSHRGVDIAWNWDHGGPNMPCYAPADGTVVVAKDGMGNTYSTGVPDWGNYVKIKHADGVYTLMAHLDKGSVCVKTGQLVKRGQQIGKMGNSGYSNGNHCHYEVYVGGSGTEYRSNPVTYTFAYPDQDVHKGDEKEYGIKHYDPVNEVGNPVPRNPMVDQIEVLATTLRARKEPNLKADVLGYVKPGIYNLYGMAEADGYKWYQPEDFWCANDEKETWIKVMKSEYVGTPVPRNERVDQIEVTATTLRARKDPSLQGEVLGFVAPGYYNCTERAEADGYKWYKAEDFWCAQSKDGDWVHWLPMKDPRYEITMMQITENQRKEVEAYCRAQNIVYVVKEV